MPVPAQISNRAFWGMIHLNENLLCSVALESLGSNPRDDPMARLSIIPLDINLGTHNEFTLFDLKFKIDPNDTLDKNNCPLTEFELADYALNGYEYDHGKTLFTEWFDNLKFKHKKKIVPLAFNWVHIHGYLHEWLGQDLFDEIFSQSYRDIQGVANYINDMAGVRGNDVVPHPKTLRYYLKNIYHVDQIEKSSLHDAFANAELYKKLLQTSMPGLL